jgi:hypothetical protein
MLTIIIAILIGCGVAWGSYYEWGWAWAVVNGAFITIVVQLVVGLYIRKQVGRVHGKIQAVMQDKQVKLNRMANQFMRRPVGGIKTMQQIMEKEQSGGVRQALEMTRELEKWFRWNILLEKQINTMRMMFHYQLKEFSKVDALMPRCLMFDARAVAMKIARMYKNGDEKFMQFFKKKVKRAKGDDAALLYSLCAWILVKQNKLDDALNLLIEAKKKTEHENIIHNWELLANGKAKQFSNAALGDIWYALHLEEQKVKVQKERHVMR